MANVKTAISLQEPLFREIELLAQELQISRSRLFALAAEAFIQRHQNRKLLQAINDAYDDLPDETDQLLAQKRRQRHRRLVEEQW